MIWAYYPKLLHVITGNSFLLVPKRVWCHMFVISMQSSGCVLEGRFSKAGNLYLTWLILFAFVFKFSEWDCREPEPWKEYPDYSGPPCFLCSLGKKACVVHKPLWWPSTISSNSGSCFAKHSRLLIAPSSVPWYLLHLLLLLPVHWLFFPFVCALGCVFLLFYRTSDEERCWINTYPFLFCHMKKHSTFLG